MQSVSQNFTNACQATVRQPQYKVYVSWDGSTWTDESARVTAFESDSRISAPGEDLVAAGDVARGSVTLSNNDGRFSWKNSSGPLYAYIGGITGPGGKRVRLQIGFGGEYVTIFTGVIIGESSNDFDSSITYRLADMGFAYLQQRVSTGVYLAQRADQWIAHLASLASISQTALDTGTHVIPHCWTDDESALEEIWSVAGADGGRAYFDGLGVLRYETPTHWTGHALVWTFDLGSEFAFQPTLSVDGIASEIIAGWEPRVQGAETVLYKLDSLKAVRPGATLEIDARFQYPAFALSDLKPGKDYAITSAAGADLGANVTVSVPAQKAFSQRATIVVQNTHAKLTAMISHLQIRGWPLVGGPTGQVPVTVSGNPMGMARTRTARGNPYRQTEPQARALANIQASRAGRIQASWPVTVAAVPQLELGDKVRIVGRRTSSPIDGFVTRSKIRFGGQGLMHDIDVMDSSGLFEYSNYYVTGTTALGLSGGRAWY